MRQLPQVHKRFFRLKFGEKFEVNGVKYQKETFLSAVLYAPANRSLVLLRPFELVPLRLQFWPWTKVRTCELVRDALPGGLSSRDLTDATLLAVRSYERVRNMKLDRGACQPHKDDERTGPSC